VRTLVLLLGLLVALLPATTTKAQIASPNGMGVSMGHVNLLAQDVDAAKQFWITLGGTPANHGPLDFLKFPGILIFVRKGEPSGGSVGSVVDHIGFYVANIRQSMGKWKAAGLKTEPGANARQGYVTTPDGLVRIEILENTSLSVPIAFDYIYFQVADTGTAGKTTMSEMQAWYAKIFGGTPGKRGQLYSDSFPGGVLLFAKSDTPTAPTQGRGLDHIGFEVRDLEAFCKRAEASGAKLDRPFTKRPELGESLAGLTDPWGTRIELNDGVAQW
jgi:catechol 2,3-dioxygenase-like lactoylglutathione lyase family enzyme